MVTFSNPFHWGICIVSDSALQDVPTLSGDAGKTRTAIVFPVHDPTAAQSEVIVRCHEQASPGKVRVEGVIDVPSKRLVVGDTNGDRSFDIPTGRCRVQVSAIPWGAATTIDIWLEVVAPRETPAPSTFES